MPKPLTIMVLVIICVPGPSMAETIKIAVATNFKPVMEQLLAEYGKNPVGASFSLTSGSSGQLYSQILFGAPFDLFFSADEERARALEGKKPVLLRKTYATGRLALFSPSLGQQNLQSINTLDVPIAIANPELAPYGAAARNFLEYISLWERFRPRLIQANSNAQVYQYVKTGHTAAGILSYSYVLHENSNDYWLIPQEYHEAINQQYAVIKQEDYQAKSADIEAFLHFIHSVQGREIIMQWGYLTK